MNFVVVLVLES